MSTQLIKSLGTRITTPPVTSRRILRTPRERAFLDRETTIESGADSGNHTVTHNEILDMFRYGTAAEEAEALRTREDAGQDVITAELRQMVRRKA